MEDKKQETKESTEEKKPRKPRKRKAVDMRQVMRDISPIAADALTGMMQAMADTSRIEEATLPQLATAVGKIIDEWSKLTAEESNELVIRFEDGSSPAWGE